MSEEISSFTAIKGLLAEETFAVLGGWDLGADRRGNLKHSEALQTLGRGSAKKVEDLERVIRRGFDLPGRDTPLVILARRSCPMASWRSILLWHTAERDRLLRRFLEEWLFQAHRAGRPTIRSSEVAGFVAACLADAGLPSFKGSTLARTAMGLLKIAGDARLLDGRVAKRFSLGRPTDTALLYALYALAERHVSGHQVLAAPEWRRFLLAPEEVELELFRLHQFGHLDYQVAGGVVQITLPYRTALEFAEHGAL